MKTMVKDTPSLVATPRYTFNNIGAVRFQLEIAQILIDFMVSTHCRVFSIDFRKYPQSTGLVKKIESNFWNFTFVS